MGFDCCCLKINKDDLNGLSKAFKKFINIEINCTTYIKMSNKINVSIEARHPSRLPGKVLKIFLKT